MTLPYVKMQGLGNSYIFIEAQRVKKYSLGKLAIAVSDANEGIGADGLIVVDTSKEPFAMRIFNRNGSEAEMCGNGLRQAALFLKKSRFPNRKRFVISTTAGVFLTRVITSQGSRAKVETSLGSPVFSAKEVGLKSKEDIAFDVPVLEYGDKKITMDCVSIGNPHAVVLVASHDSDWSRLGREISEHRMFSDGINVNFMKVINSRRFEVKTFERGSGVTAACGSGAAACLAVGVMRNILQKKAVAVATGGNLELSWDISTNTISQLGPASIICYGEYYG